MRAITLEEVQKRQRADGVARAARGRRGMAVVAASLPRIVLASDKAVQDKQDAPGA